MHLLVVHALPIGMLFEIMQILNFTLPYMSPATRFLQVKYYIIDGVFNHSGAKSQTVHKGLVGWLVFHV